MSASGLASPQSAGLELWDAAYRRSLCRSYARTFFGRRQDTFLGMRLFKHKKQGARTGSRDHVALLDAYADGFFPCLNCGHHIPVKDLVALQMVECTKCQSINFVPLKIGEFLLYEPLGGGGMGSVYKACWREAPKDLFAVKVLAREEKTHPVHIQALLNEARTAEIIGDHRCLAKGIASGYEDSEYYSAMECVEGNRLDQLIDLHQKLPEKDVLQIALHILAAEQHIYNCGFLYRDLKPENIIVNAEGYAVLIDYGLCLPRENALNPADEYVSGSPYYLPPERLLGLGEDAYSEIYSLGMVMYYALSGKAYYNADEVEALAKRHVSKVRLSMTSKLRGFRPELQEVMSKMIQQEHGARFQTFVEAATAIKEIL